MSSDELLNLALELINAGKKENARTVIRQALDRNPDDIAAWALLVQAASDIDEEMAAVKEVLRLKPDDEWAQRYLADLIDKEALNRIVDLIRLERKSQAAFLLDQVLSRNPDNPDAWALKARSAAKREDAIAALEEVLRLRPEDEQARQYLTRLTNEQRKIERKRTEKVQKQEQKEEKRSRVSAAAEAGREKGFKLSSDLIYGLMGLILLLSLVCFVIGYPMLPEDQRFFGNLWLEGEASTDSPFVAGSCEALINEALQVSDTGCQQIGRNEICYGNYDVTANVIPDYSGQFTIVGDVIPISGVKQIYASPLDLVKNLWGVAVLKLQANLPGTVPGQNVTFLVFGDTSIDNASGDMSAFYFTTGFTGVECSQVPFDGLLIQMPDGSGISFQANGVDFMLQGDAILHARPGEEMTVSMIDGTGMIRAGGQIQEMSPGTSVSVPLGDDLNPTGPPSEPSPLPDDETLLGCHLLGVGCPPEVAAVIRSPTSTPGGAELGLALPPTYTPKPISPYIPTNTPAPIDPGIPTNTSVPVPTGQPTNTPVPIPTNTSVPLPTNTSPPLPTNTSPSAPTDTSPGPTNTASGPTDTPVPGATATNTPLATNTSAPPPPTNTPAPPTATTVGCSGITSSDIVIDHSTMWFRIFNNSGSKIVIATIRLSWPVGNNGELRSIYFRFNEIYDNPNVDISPVTIPDDYPWKPGTWWARELNSGHSGVLSFYFEHNAQGSGYNVDVWFDNGCAIHIQN